MPRPVMPPEEEITETVSDVLGRDGGFVREREGGGEG